MKDWASYLRSAADSDLWGLVALDAYHRKDLHLPNFQKPPSKYIDFIVELLAPSFKDPVKAHQTLLTISVQLLGNDFADIVEKSRALVALLKPDATQLRSIIKQYEVFGQSDLCARRLSSAVDVPTNGGRALTGEAANRKSSSPLVLFYSYSHDDEKMRNKLEKHLALLRRDGTISEWHDRKLLAGSNVDREIDKKLEEARIILLLISASFMNSDYCYCTELDRALERHNAKAASVVPVILRSVDWKIAKFRHLLALPKDGVPIEKWRPQAAGYADVARGIRELAQHLKSERNK